MELVDRPALSFVIRANSTRPEMPILAANWRQAGFDMQERLVSSAESADRASLLGIPVNRVNTLVWVMAAGLSGLAAGPRAGQRPRRSRTAASSAGPA